MRKLSSREKFLLYVLLIVAILFAGVYLIKQPVDKIVAQSGDELIQAGLNKNVLEARLDQESDIDEAYESDKKFYEEHKDAYPLVTDAEKMEAEVLSYMEKHNLTPYVDNMGVNSQEMLSSQTADTITEDAINNADTTEDISAVPVVEQTGTYNPYAGSLHRTAMDIECRGTWNDFMAFLDDVYKVDFYEVETYAITTIDRPENDIPTSVSHDGVNYNFSVSVTYMNTDEYVIDTAY